MPRPRKTASAMLASGNRSELSRAELAGRASGDVVLDMGDMRPPVWLPEKLLGDFERICGLLGEHGVRDELFEDAAAHLCVCSRNLRLADQMLEAAITDPSGDVDELAKVYRMHDTAFKQWRAMLNDMGLTPRTCSYLRREDRDKPANPFAEFAAGP